MCTIVIFNGFPRSGKDEATARTIKHVKSLRKDAFVSFVSSIDPFREAVKALGLDPTNKTPEMRALLSEFKASADKHFCFSTGFLLEKAETLGKSALNDEIPILITHIREPHNIQKLEERCALFKFRTVTVLVTGRGEAVDSNTSDMNVADHKYDVTINNDGSLEQLDEGCFDLACYILKPFRERSTYRKPDDAKS